MNTNLDIINAARSLAVEAHESISQKRENGEPYYFHCFRVGEMIEKYLPANIHSGYKDEQIVAAAYLHDVFEDVSPVNPKFDELSLYTEKFGNEIVALILQVTNVYTSEAFPEFTRKQRKILEAQRLAKISYPAKLIKLADMIDNLMDSSQLTNAHRETYVREKARLWWLFFNSTDILDMLRSRLWLMSLWEIIKGYFCILKNKIRTTNR